MSSSYTSLLNLVLPNTGELNNTWGTVVNTQLTQFVENAIAQTASNNVSSADWTLDTTSGGSTTNQARDAILLAYGTPGTTRYINAPQSSKVYVVINNCTDQSSVVLRGGPSSPTTGVTILAGTAALCAWNTNVGDFVKVAGGGGAAGGGTDQVFFQNNQTVNNSYTIPVNYNAGTFGPITINTGVTVTVPSGCVWTVV